MTTMTDFSYIVERIGKTTSEKRAVEAMANALSSVENAIADGDTHYDGHCFIDDAEQYNGQSMESGEIYQQLSGFDSPDDMQLTADYLAYALCHVR